MLDSFLVLNIIGLVAVMVGLVLRDLSE